MEKRQLKHLSSSLPLPYITMSKYNVCFSNIYPIHFNYFNKSQVLEKRTIDFKIFGSPSYLTSASTATTSDAMVAAALKQVWAEMLNLVYNR